MWFPGVVVCAPHRVALPKVQQHEPSFAVCICTEWSCPWPRPSAAFAEKLPEEAVKLSADGVVDFNFIRRHVREGSSKGAAAAWFRHFSLEFGSDFGKVDLVRLLQSIAGKKNMLPLLGQLTWRLSTSLEWVLGMQSGKKLASYRVSFAYRELGGLMSSPNEVAHRLYEYVAEGVEATLGHTFMSIGTDKGQVKGLPLQNAVIVLPTNQAIVCCPQAIYVSIFSSARLARQVQDKLLRPATF